MKSSDGWNLNHTRPQAARECGEGHVSLSLFAIRGGSLEGGRNKYREIQSTVSATACKFSVLGKRTRQDENVNLFEWKCFIVVLDFKKKFKRV